MTKRAKTKGRRGGGGLGALFAMIAVLAGAALLYFGLMTPPAEEAAAPEARALAGGAPEEAEAGAAGTENVAAAGRLQLPGEGAPPSSDGAALELDPGRARVGAETASAAADALGANAPQEKGPVAPAFDVVRVGEDGSAVLAGRAEPGAKVDVLIDGAVAETVQADESGEFVAMIAPPRGPAPGEDGARRLDLSAESPDGRRATSEAPVIVTMSAEPNEPPAALRPAMEGAELLQPPPKAPDADVTIDAVTYGDQGEVTIAGRGKPGETARLYLDNTLQAEAQVAEGGDWRAKIEEDIPPAVYQLRVDQTDASGAVTARAETPFERAHPADIKLEKGAVVVQPGNNLWRIADYVYGDGARYTVIYRRNQSQIRDPNLIYPGQVFSLPDQPGG